MNEHIKELIRQSGGLSYGDDNEELTPMLVGKGLEKFAELIVKECIALKHKNVIVGGASEYNRGRREFAEDILKHFGVE